MTAPKKQVVRGFIANVALEGGRYVKLSSGKLVYCGAGEQPLGVLHDDVPAGKTGDVILEGTGKVQCAAALAAGATIASDANGRAVAATAGDYVAGKLYGPSKAPVSSTYDRADVLIPATPYQIPEP